MSQGRAVIVVFGAAVWPGGVPSPSLARRIRYAALAAEAEADALILCSGAEGRFGPSEAAVMARELGALGLHSSRLVLDEDSRDTLQSVVTAARFVRAQEARRCIVCSDGYHLPRIRLMLALLGVRTEAGPVLPGHGGAGWRRWLRMSLREALALPYDVALVLLRRRTLLAEMDR